MNFFRKHWYDIGGVLGIITISLTCIFQDKLSHYQLLMWLSIASLFFHQFEEYRLAGTFPGMVNKIMFKSNYPDRYPLNTNTSLVINVYIGWLCYLIAALLGEQFVWLGLATIIVSIGNILAHTFIFNIKGRTFYNAGMATSWLFFTPIAFYFFKIIHQEHLVKPKDYFIGISLGLVINYLGIFKLITWMSKKDTIYIFKQSQLLSQDRKS